MSAAKLSREDQDRLAIINFWRLGFDTMDIAYRLGCGQARIANMLAAILDAEERW